MSLNSPTTTNFDPHEHRVLESKNVALNANAKFELCINRVKKEVQHVQETHSTAAQFRIRMSQSSFEEAGFICPASSEISKKVFRDIFESKHGFLVAHALELQLYTFSGGSLASAVSAPLWLDLLIRGHGLRALTSQYVHQSDLILRAYGFKNTDALSARHLTDPALAYRLAKFDLAKELLSKTNTAPDLTSEISIRIEARKSQTANEVLRAIERLSEQPEVQLKVLASFLAQSAKAGDLLESTILTKLEDWMSRTRTSHDLRQGFDPLQAARIFNAVNLLHLKRKNWYEVTRNLDFLAEYAIPQIARQDTRDHVEGNYLYQRSIMCRVEGDTSGEMSFLVRALEKDQLFATSYYRLAQILHDQKDENAGIFYQMAIAVSPFDFSTVNDYGCYLQEAGKYADLEDWTRICMTIFPEANTLISEG